MAATQNNVNGKWEDKTQLNLMDSDDDDVADDMINDTYSSLSNNDIDFRQS